MRRYRVVNKDRFNRVVKAAQLLLLIVLVILFIAFMNAHNGINEPHIVECRTYEITQQTSPDNNRVKVPVAREVVYRYIYQ